MKHWFVLRVQAGREDSVKEALWKRIQTHDLEEKLSTLMVPSETVTEMKGGKRRTYTRKTYPGYIMAEVEVDAEQNIPEDVWFLIRETPGVVAAAFASFLAPLGVPPVDFFFFFLTVVSFSGASSFHFCLSASESAFQSVPMRASTSRFRSWGVASASIDASTSALTAARFCCEK